MRMLIRCIWCGYPNLCMDFNDYKKERAKLKEREEALISKYKFEILKCSCNPHKAKKVKERLDIEDKKIRAKRATIDKVLDLKQERRKLGCRCCGQISDTTKMNDEEFIKYGYRLYEEYKTFMNCHNSVLPKEILIKTTDLFGGAKCEYNKILKRWVIEINPSCQNQKLEVDSKLFHEFTHIFDGYDPNTGGDNDEANKYIWWREFHASQIQMLKMLGYKSINDNKKISKYTTIFDNNKNFMVEDYFKNYKNSHLKMMQYKNIGSVTWDIFSIIRHLMYYLGQASIFKNYLDKDILKSISSVEDFDNSLKNKLIYKDGESFSSLEWIKDCLIYSEGEIDVDSFIHRLDEYIISLSRHTPEYDIDFN